MLDYLRRYRITPRVIARRRRRLEREFVQLHRDTTVQALTLLPSLQGMLTSDRYAVEHVQHMMLLAWCSVARVAQFDMVARRDACKRNACVGPVAEGGSEG